LKNTIYAKIAVQKVCQKAMEPFEALLRHFGLAGYCPKCQQQDLNPPSPPPSDDDDDSYTPGGCTVVHHQQFFHHVQCCSCGKPKGGPHLPVFDEHFKELMDELQRMMNESGSGARCSNCGCGGGGGGYGIIPPWGKTRVIVVRPRKTSAETQTSGDEPEEKPQMTILGDSKCTGTIIHQLDTIGNNLNVADIPYEFKCPITKQIMTSPIVMSDGYSYDASAILKYVNAEGQTKSVLTGKDLSPLVGFYNVRLAEAIVTWLKNYMQNISRRGRQLRRGGN
jgi:hypothetical protein